MSVGPPRLLGAGVAGSPAGSIASLPSSHNSETIENFFDPYEAEVKASRGKIQLWTLEEQSSPKRIHRYNFLTHKEGSACYKHLEVVRNFFREVYNHDVTSINGITVFLNDKFSLNRSYTKVASNFIFLGIVEPNHFNPLPFQLDILAHEVAHTVAAQRFTHLRPEGEADALIESYCDVCAIQVKHYYEKVEATHQKASWTIGDGFFKARHTSLRSLSSPGSARKDHPFIPDDLQPRHFDNYVRHHERESGHTNCGIPSHAFYLAATEIGGHTWETVGQIWDAAMKDGYTHDLKSFAASTVDQAIKLSQNSVAQAIRNAWDNVGIDYQDVFPCTLLT